VNPDSPATADPGQLSSRVVATGLLATGLALLTMVLALTAFDYWSSRQAMLADSRVEAAIVADNISTAVMFRDAHTAEEILGALKASPMVLMAGIYDAQGVLFASYQRDGDQVAPGTLPGGGNGDFEHQGLYLLEMAKPVKFRGKSSGSIYLRKSMGEVYTHLVIRFGGALLIAGGTMALATALVLRSRAAVGEAERRLQVLAHQDAVTGVGNRHFFNERLAHEIDRAATLGSKLALVYIDLDNFKTLNDTFGHAAGDGLLRQVAQRLQSVVRAGDDICRMGGDEFSVILRLDMDEAALGSYAERIIAVFEKGFVESDQEVMVTCSAGIATYPGDAPDRDSLISCADTAMYRAKDLGKNRCERFDASMNLAAVRRHAIEKALRQVLEDGQGLALHYQPVFSAGDQKMIGAEALLRWSHDRLGHIPPLEAVMVAEECGLIVHLGYWVVRTACRDAARWQAQGRAPLRVAVNVSARQLNDPQFLERVMDILREEGLPAHLLEIELTETVLMENMDACASTLHRLSQLGVHLAIDDFGTGYSSLAYLRRLPMKRLKIDRSFIRDLPEQEHSRMIVKAIIALSHGLGLAVTAEGVETQAQIDYLVDAGCDVLQGFAFARPMPVEQFEAMQAAR